jgi:hypothetical protein
MDDPSRLGIPQAADTNLNDNLTILQVAVRSPK